MATLYFKIGADYENVIRLRDEIKKLENQLRSFGKSTPETQIRQTEERLATTRQEFVRLTTEAAKAGAVMESDFKKKIYDASQTVNDLSEKIIAQRTVVREAQADVKRLGEAYRTALKTNPIGASGIKTEYNAARKALDEEKAALFGLTQEQATARLSVKKLRDEYNLFKDESGDVKDAIGDITGQMKNWIAGIAGGIGIKEFLGQLIQVRGEFENIETSLKVLLGGDSEKLADIMSQMKEYALISPLTTKDMASALQMMIGFGIQAEDAITYLKALGDISMGDTTHFNSLALAFSQMSAAGKLMGQDLNQMINAGFNPLQQISEKTGKSIGELKDEMSKGAISAQMVQQAFIDATSAGGKFYGMAAEGAKTINGQISMLQESVDNMFNDMGQASESIILNSIQAITKLVENYDKVGAVIIGLVTAYGTYKAALLTSMALEQARNGTLLTTIKNTKLATAAQNLFNKTVKAHPYALIASLAIGAAAAIYSLVKRTDEVSASQKALDEVSRNYNATVKSEQAEIDRLFDALRNAKEGTNEYQKAKDDILSKYGKYLNGLNSEISTLHDVESAYKAVTAAARESARARAIESATSKAQEIYGESYTENVSKLRNALIKQVGETRSSAILAQLRKDLRDTGKVSEQVRKQIGDALTGDFSYGESKAWLTGLERNEKELKDAYKEIDDLFKETEKSTTEKSSNLLKDYNEAAKSYENAQKRLDEINANRSKYTTKQYEDAVTKLKTAKGNFEKLGGETQTNKQRQSAAVKAENKRKKEADERKKAQEELNKSLLSLQQQNQDDEIALMQEGTQKRLAEIKNDYKKRIAEIDKQEAEFKKKNKEAGATGLTGGLTKDQQTALQEARDNAAKEQRKQVKEVVDEENDTRIAALQNYLKVYGDYEQKRLAITEEYNKKIADATSQVEKTSLQAELEKTLSELDFNEFKNKFNWEAIFGNLGDLTLKQLEDIRAQLRVLLADDNLGIDEYKTAVEQIDKINEAIVSEQGKLKDAFGLILPMAEERRKLELDVAEANARQNELLAEQQELLNGIEAKRQNIATTLQNAGIDINASDVNIGNQDAILLQLENILGADSDIYKSVSKSFDELNKSERDLNNTTQKLGKAQSDAASAQSKLNKFLSDFGNKLQAVNEIMSLVSSNMQSLPDLFSQLGVDMGSELGQGITDLANASQYASSAIQDAMGGNFVGALSNGIGAVKGVLSGFNNILGLGIGKGNAEETAEKIERLTESNDYLRTSIDRLTEKMDDAAGGRAIGYYEEAKDAQERYNENLRQILDADMRYSAAHHSNAYYWELDPDSLKQVNELLGTSLGNTWNDFSNLTAEQMDDIRTHLPDVWEEMINEGKYGDRFREDWENYADQAGKVEELTEQIRDNLTQTSFDSLRSSFLDTLMDMDADASDFADDFSEMMQRALLNFAMGDLFDDKLKEWYDNLADDIGASGGDLGNIDIEKYREEWQDMADEWLGVRDAISDITGYDGSGSNGQQSATGKGYETMSQDVGNALVGRATAMYEAELRIETQGNAQAQSLADLNGSVVGIVTQAQGIYNIADETRNILANSYLELQEINENTGNSAKFLKDIKTDIAIVKQNTSRI